MARPRKKIDPKLVSALAEIACTSEEIAHALDCSVDLLERRFADVVKRGRMMARVSVRRHQFLLMKQGNLGAAIWLGKQLLGQRDRIDTYSVHDMRSYSERFAIHVINVLREEVTDPVKLEAVCNKLGTFAATAAVAEQGES